MGHRATRMILTLVVGLGSCTSPTTSTLAPSTPPVTRAQPPLIAKPGSARPPQIPPAAPATLGVNDMVGHPARWNGEAVILFARLRYDPEHCTSKTPTRCTGRWQLVDADDARSMVVTLDPAGLEIPAICRARSSDRVTPSPCVPDELDPTQRYRLEGHLAYARGNVRFVATRIEAVRPEPLPANPTRSPPATDPAAPPSPPRVNRITPPVDSIAKPSHPRAP